MGRSPYGTRDLVAVTPFGTATFKYGFRTNTLAADRTTLGQVAAVVNGDYIAGLVLGANSPKPATATKFKAASGSESSFCSAEAIDDARAAGWQVRIPPRKVAKPGTKYTKTVYVTVGALDGDGNPTGPQFKYGWRMPLFLFSSITPSDLTALGIKQATSGDTDIVFGANYPKPPRASLITTPASGAQSRKTTFVDPNKLDSLPAGWGSA